MVLGARRLHVLPQFPAEAVVLSVTDAVAGVLIGVTVSEIVSAVANWPIVILAGAMAGGFVVSAGVDILFGYYSARKAAALGPIEALPYE
jgi:macrolide transport system ATP-binding/permease protein